MWQIIAIEFAVPEVFFRAVYPLGAKKKKSAFVLWGFPGGAVVKNLLSKQKMLRDMGLTPGLGRSPGGGNGNLLQCSCLGNPMGQWSFWWATVHGVTKSRIRLFY